jgi:putative endonuclease
MYIVYILRTSKDTLYIGQTDNLDRRLTEHKSKGVRTAKYLRYFNSFQLVYSEKFKTRSEAMQREYKLKQWTRSQKEALIAGTMS